MIEFSNVQFASSLAGLENYDTIDFNFSVDAHNLAAGNASSWTSSWPIVNTDAISTTLIQYSLDSIWRYNGGAMTLSYAAGTYDIETITYYYGGSLNVETYIINETGGTISIPQFYVSVRAELFNAPF